MSTPRLNDTATLLGNGNVLVTGGGNDFFSPTAWATAEVYSPASNDWTATGSMSNSRYGQTATLLANGQVLVTGGSDGSHILSSAELYDPASQTWSSAGSMATKRIDHTATLLPDGQVLVTGGYYVSPAGTAIVVASAELYDPITNSWSAAAPMTTPRKYQTATLLENGKVLIAGGDTVVNNHYVGVASAEVYDPADDTWSPAGTMAAARAYHTATLLGNGKVLVAGGDTSLNVLLSTAELYDPSSNTWTSASAMPSPRGYHTATLLGNGKVLIAGGWNPTDQDLPSTLLYDPESNAWSATGSLITPRDSQTATLLPSGHVFITGGERPSGNSYTALASAESYDPAAANPASKLVISIGGNNSVVAGAPFLVTVRAADQFGNAVTSYSGASTAALATNPLDPQAKSPITVTLDGGGFGFLLENLKTAGSYTLTATAGSISGTTSSITVAPADANHFALTAPATATTGSSVNVTVTALDPFGNIATRYSGHVHFTSSGPRDALPADATLSNGVGTFAVTLNSAGSQTITATDAAATNPVIVGTSSAITTRGLVVSGFTPAPTGFTTTFSKPFVPDNISLWGGTVAKPIQDVTLIGDNSGPVNGSLIIDPTNTSVIFKVSTIYLSTFFQSSVLPNDTWHVRLVSGSGSNGFVDALGAGLDGANDGGRANYTTTFTTSDDGQPVLSIPDFARGPDGGHTIKVPNESATGIPVTLANAGLVKDVVFALSYNPTLLTPLGASPADAPPGSAFTLGAITSIDATHATVLFTFHNNTAQNGTLVLGDILASVPDSAANQYKAKELLGLGPVTVNGAVFTGVVADGMHVNAYLGDVSGNGSITALDVATANTVAQGSPTSPIGLAGYKLVDPAIVGDIADDASIDATAISDLATYTANLHPPQIPALPAGLTITPGGPDPTLSLGVAGRIENPSYVIVPVLLDNPHPQGSTGMTEAILALTYDPKVLSVSPADVTLGSIPGLSNGWHLVSVVDQTTGQIGIDLYSTTAITAAQAGSLVNITFHIVPAAAPTTTAVQLVSDVSLYGQQFATQLDDAQGQLVLTSGVNQVAVESASWPARSLPRHRHGRSQGTGWKAD